MAEPTEPNHYQTLELRSSHYQSQPELCFTRTSFAELQEQVLNYLHPEELRFCASLKFKKRQQSYLLGRFAAKQAISRYDKKVVPSRILIKPGIFGYPVACYLSNKRVQTTISHCDCLGAALAFSEMYQMGIDIESIKPDHTITISTQLTCKEKKLIDTYPYVTGITTDTLHTVFWAIKEALSKVLRLGLLASIKIYEIKNIISRGNYWINEFENFYQYQGLSFLIGQQVCSVVYPKQTHLVINIPTIQDWIIKTYR